MAESRALRLGMAGFVAVFLLLLTAAGASAAPPPQSQLTAVRSQLSGLGATADSRGKAALAAAVVELERATAETLWIDPRDAVPPPNGDAVFAGSSGALQEIASILGDHSVSRGGLRAASGEILEAQADLATNAMAQVRPAPPWGGGPPLPRWQLAFALVGEQATQVVSALRQSAVEEAATNYLLSSTDELLAEPESITGPPLSVWGRPEVFLLGSEGCPFCAIDRWSIVVALAQFGRFAPLAVTVSSTYDLDPATRTFRFSNLQYFSPYIAFVPLESWSNQPGGSLRCFGETYPWWTEIQAPTPSEEQLINRYDTVEGCLGSIPFLDVANRWASYSSYANPSVIAGMSWEQIARSLSSPGSPVAQDIDGGAEILTAQICDVDGGQPAHVCDSSTVRRYQEAFAPSPG
jgi:uncharacterized protein DUF929